MDNTNLWAADDDGWCAECGSQVGWLTAGEAALLSGAGELFMRLWAEDGMVHLGEAEDGTLTVCVNSPLLV